MKKDGKCGKKATFAPFSINKLTPKGFSMKLTADCANTPFSVGLHAGFYGRTYKQHLLLPTILAQRGVLLDKSGLSNFGRFIMDVTLPKVLKGMFSQNALLTGFKTIPKLSYD